MKFWFHHTPTMNQILLASLVLAYCHAHIPVGNYAPEDFNPDPDLKFSPPLEYGNEFPNTKYQPGTPGAAWTKKEIEITRERVEQMFHPHWDWKKQMYGENNGPPKNPKTQITENRVLRLAFHDCIKYKDGTGGCDGCLNWEGVGIPAPENNNKKQMYSWEAPKNTTKNGLHGITKALEAIYKSVNWPSGKSDTLKSLKLKKSLYQSGKSRADLWQLAGLIALERQIERSNRACDLDYMARQQVTNWKF